MTLVETNLVGRIRPVWWRIQALCVSAWWDTKEIVTNVKVNVDDTQDLKSLTCNVCFSAVLQNRRTMLILTIWLLFDLLHICVFVIFHLLLKHLKEVKLLLSLRMPGYNLFKICYFLSPFQQISEVFIFIKARAQYIFINGNWCISFNIIFL